TRRSTLPTACARDQRAPFAPPLAPRPPDDVIALADQNPERIGGATGVGDLARGTYYVRVVQYAPIGLEPLSSYALSARLAAQRGSVAPRRALGRSRTT